MSEHRVWTVEMTFTEDDNRTQAEAQMRAGTRILRGRGRARRNPVDSNVPAIGEELAAARALSDLTDQLVHLAAHTIEAFEGHPVSVHG
jgi:hypothetical protein